MRKQILATVCLMAFHSANAQVTLTDSRCKYKYEGNKIEATCTAAETNHVCVATGSMAGGMNFAQQIVAAKCRTELAQRVESSGNAQKPIPKPAQVQIPTLEKKNDELTEKEKQEQAEFKIFKEAYEFCKKEGADFSDEQCMAFGMKAANEAKKPKSDCAALVGKESGDCDGSHWQRVDENNLSSSVDASERGLPSKDFSSPIGEQVSGSASKK